MRFLQIACLGALLLPTPALTAVMDGAWCAQDGRTMIIHGDDVTIPSGKQITGDLSAHAFSYVIPDGEPGAGADVSMSLLNQETLRVTRGVPPGTRAEPEPEIWHRCKPAA